ASSDVPCVRLIDFGICSFTERDTIHKFIWGENDSSRPLEFVHYGSYIARSTTVWQAEVVMLEIIHQ
ncbi:hypothetical protein FQA47_012517, partial [Oryzias melastigma]